MASRLESCTDLIAFDLHFVGRHLGGGIIDARPGFDVELPTMPRAGHHIPFHITLSQRTTTVYACVIDDMIRAVDIEDRESLAVDFCDHPAPRLDIAG